MPKLNIYDKVQLRTYRVRMINIFHKPYSIKKDILTLNKSHDYLIVGSGIYGTVMAHELNKRGKKVLIIEKSPSRAFTSL